MRKSVFGRQLGRDTNERKALFRSLVVNLFQKGAIKTTLAKAKAVKKDAEKLITKAKRGTLTDRRIIHRYLAKNQLVNLLVDKIAPQLKDRKSGYLRILRLGVRKGDAAPMALLSFVDPISFETEESTLSKNTNKTQLAGEEEKTTEIKKRSKDKSQPSRDSKEEKK